ncbi:hypothetical protein [Pseudoxanthomonas sp. PXM01]|uniref:hypothetical protein n=1 Tax=Pseudoxanthomonas sp. PXM01 TaxID=2769295 RepID=UPI00177F8706|nr:hypothetical protein [Pseudoxanthomonas sp. PXM01]MBD9471164.1 hypothetical protein [Pseudoxanthomonas sp. PXM01]
MRFLLLALILSWHSSALAAKCPVYLYTDQPNQDPLGLLKLDRNSEEALRGQIPDAPAGKLCWYTQPDGTLVAQRPNPNKRYIFIRSDGRWTFSEVQEIVSVTG